MESNRQKRIGKVLQKEIAEYIRVTFLTNNIKGGVMVSVTQVSVTVDLSIAKVYVSIYPFEKAQDTLLEIEKMKYQIKHHVAVKTKNQLRKMPDLSFFIDDSLEYIKKIDEAIKGEDNPIYKIEPGKRLR